MEPQDYASQVLDHLGLVAGMCQEIGISQAIDEMCPSNSPDQIVSTGKALEAMILNDLGFVNKRLYLIPHFFRDKPIELLLGPGIAAKHLDDDRLGRALDRLYETGLITLFAKLSRQTFKILDYQIDHDHLDTTSLSISGQYNSEEADTANLHITQGYNKDHRPDLPQVTLQVLQSTKLNWICRVPATLDAVKALLQQIKPDSLTALEQEGYSSACYTFDYGGVDQYWVVYHSLVAAQREAKTLQRRQEKEAQQARKSLNKLQSQAFHCKEDAQQAAHKWQQQ